MRNYSIGYCLVIIVLSLTGFLVMKLNYGTYYKQEDSMTAVGAIPVDMGIWHGTDIHLDPIVFDILETRAIIHRNYTDKIQGNDVFLSIVYYQDTKVDFHAPESCLAGQGYTMSKTTKTIAFPFNGQSKVLQVSQLIRQSNIDRQLIYYFYKNGDYIGNSYIKLRFHLAKNKLFFSRRSGSLIRTSTVLKDSKIESADGLLVDFIETLYPYLMENL